MFQTETGLIPFRAFGQTAARHVPNSNLILFLNSERWVGETQMLVEDQPYPGQDPSIHKLP